MKATTHRTLGARYSVDSMSSNNSANERVRLDSVPVVTDEDWIK